MREEAGGGWAWGGVFPDPWASPPRPARDLELTLRVRLPCRLRTCAPGCPGAQGQSGSQEWWATRRPAL